MDSTALIVLGGVLVAACIVGLLGLRKWQVRQGFTRGRKFMIFGKAADQRDREPSASFEFVVVSDRKPSPDERLRQEIIETIEVGEPVMLIEETSEDGHADFRVVVSDGTIGYVAKNRVTKLQAITAAGASMRCEISYIVRQPEGAGIWVKVDVLPDR